MLGRPVTFRRTATAISLIAAAVLSLIGMAATPWEPAQTTTSFIETISANATAGQIAPLFLHYGWVALAAGVAGLFAMLHRRGAVLGHLAGMATFIGVVNLTGLLLIDWFAIGLGRSDVPIDTAATAFDSIATPLFIAGWAIPGLAAFILGLPAFLLALWRSGFLPWWPAATMFVFLVAGEVLPSTNPILAIGLSVPYSAVLGYVGLRVLHTSDVTWATTGLPIDIEDPADGDPALAGTPSSTSTARQMPRPASHPAGHTDGRSATS